MAQQHRLPMVTRELLREIAQIVSFELRDPRLKMVTITKVEAAQDLKTAKVYFSLIGDAADRAMTQRGLTDARNFIRAQLRARMKSMRYIPELTFRFDESIEGSVRISKLIDQVSKELKPDALKPGADEGEDSDGET